MTKNILIVLAPIIGLSAPAAGETTFTATAGGNTITIFSHSDTEEICEAVVPFSFIHEGERKPTETKCNYVSIIISDNAEVCSVTHQDIVEPKIEGPVRSTCR